MKYLIRANKVVFSGNMQMIMKYISDFYKSESKMWTDKDGNFTEKCSSAKIFLNSEIDTEVPSHLQFDGILSFIT